MADGTSEPGPTNTWSGSNPDVELSVVCDGLVTIRFNCESPPSEPEPPRECQTRNVSMFPTADIAGLGLAQRAPKMGPAHRIFRPLIIGVLEAAGLNSKSILPPCM